MQINGLFFFFLLGWKLGKTWFSKAELLPSGETRGAASKGSSLQPFPSPAGSSELAQLILPGGGRLLVLLVASTGSSFPAQHCLSSHRYSSFWVWFVNGTKHFGKIPSRPWSCGEAGPLTPPEQTGPRAGTGRKGAGSPVLPGAQRSRGAAGSVPAAWLGCKKRLLRPGRSSAKGRGLQGPTQTKEPSPRAVTPCGYLLPAGFNLERMGVSLQLLFEYITFHLTCLNNFLMDIQPLSQTELTLQLGERMKC